VRTTDLHHAGPFVVLEQQRALDTPGRHHDARGADLEIALVEGVAVRASLERGHQVVVVRADQRRAWQHPDVLVCGNGRGQVPGPLIGRGAIAERPEPMLEGAAEPWASFEKHHARSVPRRREGRLHAGCPTAHDAYLRVEICLVVATHRAVIRFHPADAGDLADLFRRDRPHSRRLVHEAVVEASRHRPVELVQEAELVAVGRASDVLWPDTHARHERRRFGRRVGHPVDCHHGVGALAIETVEATGSVVLQAATEDPNTVGEHRRRHGVARHSGHWTPVVGEAKFCSRVDAQGR